MTPSRIAGVCARIAPPLLVTSPANVTYLTGFKSTNAAVLVEPDRVRLFADARYSEAGRLVPDVDFVETGRVLLADLATRLQGVVGFEEEHLSFAGHHTLASDGLELVPTRGVVEGLRATKDSEEVVRIAAAAAIGDRVFSQLAAEDWLGRSERELAARLQVLILEAGGEGPAFDVIVGSGPNGAKPHARPGDRRIEDGDLVVVDFGVLLDGYRSDVARTVAIGATPAQLVEIFDVCLQAHRAALAEIRVGMTGREADAIARNIITDAGYGTCFGHGLGHGIGLDVHEPPFLSPAFDAVVEVGQVVTVEPGIYLSDLGGVRIENLCVVREDGLESITQLDERWPRSA